MPLAHCQCLARNFRSKHRWPLLGSELELELRIPSELEALIRYDATSTSAPRDNGPPALRKWVQVHPANQPSRFNASASGPPV